MSLAMALALPAASMAQDGISADPEMLTPRFGYGAIPGVPIPDAFIKNTVRWGVIMQYQRNPVTGYRLDEEVGAIVSNRMTAHLGVSWDIMDRLTARLILPTAVHWGVDPGLEDFGATGLGFGDIGFGAQFVFLKTPWVNLGVQADLFVPSGRSSAYMGEASVRGVGGLMAMAKVGKVFDITVDASVLGRGVVDTGQDFDLGPELILSEAARVKLPWIPLAFTQSIIGRGGFTNFFQGGAENGLEFMGGVQVPLTDLGSLDIRIDAMAGRGTNQGYGTTDLRILGGITFQHVPGRKPPEVVDLVIPPPPPPPVIEEPEPEHWDEGTPAAIIEDRIEIRDPIEFEVDTARILDQSLPILQAVADILNIEARVGHLLIEGHASEEGSYDYNYKLSVARAQAIFHRLILNGVAPDRLSYRGMGEVRPKVTGDTEDALAINRRVEFKILQWLTEFDEFPEYGGTTVLPWDGRENRIVQPPSPEEVERQKFDAERAERDAREGTFESFEDPVEGEKGEDFTFEGEDSAPPAPEPEVAPEPEPEPDFEFEEEDEGADELDGGGE